MATQKTIFVGLSGGVDSSVAALRLLRAGHKVVGVFIKVWHPDWLECNWEQERLDAMRVAAKLNIPFLTCDAEKAYEEDVAAYFISEYKAGRTPNPDVMCNQYVKFGAFIEFAKAHGADAIATGHYAKKVSGEGELAELHRGIDTNKDQSYFLWTLSQEQLDFSLFPVGDSEKSTIRQEASDAGLLTAGKRDSQGICFLGQVDIKEFLGHYTTLVPGNVIDKSGDVIGTHDGALIYTVGQRHGFTLADQNAERKPHYVVSRDLEANTVTVAETKPILTASTNTLSLQATVLRRPLAVGDTLSFQTRYRQEPVTGRVTGRADDTLTIKPLQSTELPAIGQSCVLYDADCCLGGGIIAECPLP